MGVVRRHLTVIRRTPRTFLIVIVLVGLVVRLAFWFLLIGFGPVGGGDEPGYHRLAVGLAEGRGFVNEAGDPTASRPPLYPALLAAVYSATATDANAARALQVLLGTCIVFLVCVLAERLFSPAVALLSAALIAVNPALVYLSALIMTENVYTLLLLLFLIALAPAFLDPPGSLRRFAGAGVLAGLCSLARPTGLTVAFVTVAALLAVRGESIGRRLVRGLVLLSVTCAVILPWSLRNYERLGDWVGLTSHGGITFYESNCRLNYEVPEFRGTVVLPRRAVPGWEGLKELSETELDRQSWKMGISFLRENPRTFVTMARWKFARFWRLRSDLGDVGARHLKEGKQRGVAAWLARHPDIFSLYWTAVLPLFLVGLFVTGRRYRRMLPLYAVIVAHVLTAIAFHGSLRARAPIEPLMSVYAAAGIAWLAGIPAGRRRIPGVAR